MPVKIARYAKRLLQRYDASGDGKIDEAERRRMQGDPASLDFDADGAITLDELAAYTADYGRHRRMRLTGTMVDEAVAELPPLYIPTVQLDAMAAAQAAQQAAQPAETARAGQSDQADLTAEEETALADGALAEEEPEAEAETAKQAGDADQPAEAQEAASQAAKRFVTPKSRLAALPDWFRARDANGDGQLTVAEYTPNSEKARLAEFARYDANNDGVITAQECAKSTSQKR